MEGGSFRKKLCREIFSKVTFDPIRKIAIFSIIIKEAKGESFSKTIYLYKERHYFLPIFTMGNRKSNLFTLNEGKY